MTARRQLAKPPVAKPREPTSTARYQVEASGIRRRRNRRRSRSRRRRSRRGRRNRMTRRRRRSRRRRRGRRRRRRRRECMRTVDYEQSV